MFYGISLPSDITLEEDVKLVFDNIKEASDALKKLKGSRFKAFDSIEDAIIFSKSTIVNKEITSCDQNKNIESDLNPFSSLHPRELSKLRKAIEGGDFSLVEQLIQTNPRFLISGCDTPSILMEGPRYNACHISAKANRHQILRLILNTVSDKKFWKQLFPFDTNEITENRIEFSLDLYLNTPCSERALCDTPLHLGCKWGSLETVSVLLSYPKCDVEKTNKFGRKPSEVICERNGNQNIKTEILKLFESQLYIPVIRDDFIAQIGKPCKGSIETQDLNGELAAVAGPMSPQQAERLYQTLKSPHKCTPSERRIRLTDSRKGLERVCRNLCKDMDINWTEFWPFLDSRIDLTSEEGLNRLETHLQHIYYDLDRNSSKVRNCLDLQSSENESKEYSVNSELFDRMSKLSLNSSDGLQDKPIDSIADLSVSEQIFFLASDLNYEESNDSFTTTCSSPVFLYEFYVNGSEISREDIDAALALQHMIESNHLLEYDFIRNWFKRIREQKPQYFETDPTTDPTTNPTTDPTPDPFTYSPLSSTPKKF